jgi:nucleotide-binding universal stress UspA family protein
MAYRSVVVAFDGSEGANAALASAVEIAWRDGAALTVVEATAEQIPSVVPGAPRQSPPENAGQRLHRDPARRPLRRAGRAAGLVP